MSVHTMIRTGVNFGELEVRGELSEWAAATLSAGYQQSKCELMGTVLLYMHFLNYAKLTLYLISSFPNTLSDKRLKNPVSGSNHTISS